MPFNLSLERTTDIKDIAGIMYGPLVMVGKADSTEYIELHLDENNISDRIMKTVDPLIFELDGMLLMPNYLAWDSPYHAYFKLV